jgi:hypothetical protein
MTIKSALLAAIDRAKTQPLSIYLKLFLKLVIFSYHLKIRSLTLILYITDNDIKPKFDIF